MNSIEAFTRWLPVWVPLALVLIVSVRAVRAKASRPCLALHLLSLTLLFWVAVLRLHAAVEKWQYRDERARCEAWMRNWRSHYDDSSAILGCSARGVGSIQYTRLGACYTVVDDKETWTPCPGSR